MCGRIRHPTQRDSHRTKPLHQNDQRRQTSTKYSLLTSVFERAKTDRKQASSASQPRQVHENGRKESRFESWFTHHLLPPSNPTPPKPSTHAQSTDHQAATGAQDKGTAPRPSVITHQPCSAARAKTDRKQASSASQPRQVHENGRKESRFESWFTH
eukprot:SAG31_NODE_3389_length_4328_cov_4.670449_1_plen_156_part_10